MPSSQVVVGGPALSGATNDVSGWSRSDTLRTVFSALIVLCLIIGAYVLQARSNGDATPAFSLLIGTSLGIVFERGRFCFYCIFREAIEERVTRPLLSVIAALVVGAVGHAVLFGLFLPNPKGEGLPPNAHISPVSIPLILGAFAFGIGMVLSGACISGHLYRLGQGYLRAIPALFGSLIGFGLGFLTWNTLYLNQISSSPVWWLPRWLGYGGSLVVTIVVLGSLAIYVFVRDTSTREQTQPANISSLSQVRDMVLVRRWSPAITGSIVGLIGVFAYLRVSPLGVTAQLSTVSRTFLDGQGKLPEVLHGIDLMKGCVGVVANTITNNGWLVIGMVAASFAAALGGTNFSVTKLTAGNSLTALLGGVLLGWGSMTALGCTVGVLLSGVQAFALSGAVFGLALFAGVFVGLKLKLHRVR